MVGVILTLVVKPGLEIEFLERIKEFKQAVDEDEGGNLYYDVFKSKRSGEFIVLEKFVDYESLRLHSFTNHKKDISPRVGECLNEKPKIEILEGI